MDNWCVYMHISPNGKKYIGITGRKPKERWQNGKGYSHNEHFSSAIIKYGWDNFSHEILFENLNQDTAKRLEQICILLLRTYDREYGYNKTFGGENPTFYPGYISPNARKIYCLETDTIYNSLAEAQRAFNFPTYTGILENCSGKYKHTHGYHFCYAEDREQLKLNKKDINEDDKRVYCFTNNTIYKSTGEAAKLTKTPIRTVQRRCIDNNRALTNSGYSFCYYRNLKEGEI